ncbi:class I SAM-dependent methyltransferase [Desulfobacula sp.]|uniref:Class I SAM-dependent methyltransferase n=1 Tax=Candidatus Desulfatibia vada TaxID=2841696 RepID=A0A8J6TRQ7_9BACT|nr:class I SAM-dependent methyltransferase [Candidatus Desulfatibia vada]MBL6996620.1 class I SAM-dependent methyltransferase [Desulfobacula sp.]
MKGNILGISGIGNFYPLIDMRNVELTEVNYPEADMQHLPYEDNGFDFVISDQVIEHLEDPKKAIKESYRVLNKDGIAIHTTCFINYIHSCPKDFWRFSPDALRYLCQGFSEILHCEGWGNRIAILLCFLSDRFRFMRIPEIKWSIRRLIATYNEEKYPIVTWVVAKK